MRILGITGGIGAGKSAVTAEFVRLGAAAVDADRIAREVLEPGGAAFAQVTAAFGPEILTPEGRVNRKALAAVVFGNPARLAELNALTHPCIFREMERRIAQARAALLCLDVPLLFDGDFPIRCHRTLAVLAPREVRIRRVMERDGCSRAQAEARMAAQLSQAELRRRADLILVNDGTVEALRRRVEQLYQEIMR